MNSVLQQLYMMPPLRKGILEVENTSPPTADKDPGSTLLFYIKVLKHRYEYIDIIWNAKRLQEIIL